MQQGLSWPGVQDASIAAIGECMIELREVEGRIERGFAGDTLNTAVYLARLLERDGARVRYVTALGDDPFSDDMLRAWQGEGIDTSLVRIVRGTLPGLYWIETGADGERAFYYWRDRASARSLLDGANARTLRAALAGVGLLYLTGISVAIVNKPERLLSLVQELRRDGTLIAFDSNYRPQLWKSPTRARAWLERCYRQSDVAMVSFADERAVFGDDNPAAACRRLRDCGIGEVVMTDGSGDVWSCTDGEPRAHPPAKAEAAVDTTGAGDAFNAGYMAARLQRASVADAARAAQRLAARVVSVPGAIIPRGA